ncbi:MAG: gluconate 2-dehydrogenase subunit 3 family protein [Bacteroidota bacterium]
MTRRHAIGTIFLGGAAFSLLPACNFEELPTFQHFEVERTAFERLEVLSRLALPINDLPLETPEPTVNYILTVVDQSYKPEDRTRFVEGMTAYPEFMKANSDRRFKKWTAEDVLAHLELMESLPAEEPIGYFYQTTKGLSKQHFTTSPYYMRDYLDYQFIPGGYEGCVPV